MLSIRNFTIGDARDIIDEKYVGQALDSVEEMILAWEKKEYNERYFEMFGIFNEQNLVGLTSLYEKTSSLVSVGIEVFEKHRKKGYAKRAIQFLMEYAKKMGYSIIMAEVRIDNLVSCKLFESLQYEIVHQYINGKNNKVYLLIRLL